MAYPNSAEYVRVLQRPDLAFRTPALRRAVFELHPLYQIPMPASGNAAVVFKADVEGRDQALRFFIREDASSPDRYNALGAFFADRHLLDCVATTRWIDDAIEVNHQTWPMVQMEWIDGRTLDAYVNHLIECGDVGSLRQLAGCWRTYVHRLQNAEFAHGDLQHGNVLIDTSSALRLVDFDGSWIPAFAGARPPQETGNPNYQRTGRTWGRWMDTFSGLVIYTALLVVSRRPDVWSKLHNGENMLLSYADFAPPFNTPAWRLLSGIQDPEIQSVVERLRQSCDPRWNPTGPLDELLGRERVLATPRPPVSSRHSLEDPALPWWMNTARENGQWPPPVSVGAMPPPPPKVGMASPEPAVFTGPNVQRGSWFATTEERSWPGSVPAPTPLPPSIPPSIPPWIPPSIPPSNIGQALAISAGIGLGGGFVLALIVEANRGSAGVAFVIGFLVAFLISLVTTIGRSR